MIKSRVMIGLAAWTLISFVHPVNAQRYSLDWHTIDGGGGTSTGGVYSVTGTIGQPDVGAMSGGQFTLTGGFWALPAAVQGTNAPTLIIAPASPGFAKISWDAAPGGLCAAGTGEPFLGQLDQRSERRNQPRDRPNRTADDVLSPAQTLTTTSETSAETLNSNPNPNPTLN